MSGNWFDFAGFNCLEEVGKIINAQIVLTPHKFLIVAVNKQTCHKCQIYSSVLYHVREWFISYIQAFINPAWPAVKKAVCK